MIYSHKRENNELEKLSDHLQEVSDKCSYFSSFFGSEDWGKLIGVLHDLGKNTKAFQDRLLNDGPKVDHSTIGAQVIFEKYKYIPAFCIAGHHTGLMNGGSSADVPENSSLHGRLKRKCLPLLSKDFMPDSSDWAVKNPKIQKIVPDNITISAAAFIRMLYSCLVDADYLCTERFMNPSLKRENFENFDFQTCLNKMEDNYISLKSNYSKLNEIRNNIVVDCKNNSLGKDGIYSLFVPTGTGKTLASMYFALNHLLKTKKRRIIYIIPYTSIVEQNANVFRNLFGDVVLEHHCNVDFDDSNDEISKFQLATENWDMPIIVTTNVQFFNSLFANKSSKLRKLHNISNSVLVFDEVQMIPNDYLNPCLYSIAELVTNYHCSALFCSATQPPFDPFFDKYSLNIIQIIKDNKNIFSELKRVIYRNEGILSVETLSDCIVEKNQVLCIVNSKKIAKVLFELVKEKTGKNCYYLTTNLCAIHRSKIIKDIKNNLSSNKSCIVISTSLVEAGVDLDFPRVFRQLSGIDSIVQAAGRCNREGKRLRKDSIVSIFETEENYNKNIPLSIKQKSEITKSIIAKYGCDFDNPNIVKAYYELLYLLNGSEGFDIKGIMGMNSCRVGAIPFQDIAESFSLIENNEFSIVIPFDANAEKKIELIHKGIITKEIRRALSPYMVNISVWKLKILQEQGAIEIFDKSIIILADERKYKDETGLEVDENDTGNAVFA